MSFRELVEHSRTRRKFDESKAMDTATLTELVELTRFMPSAKNVQPLKYVVTTDKDQCNEITSLVGWAGYLKDWKGPVEGERPTGYIIMMLDKNVADDPYCDHGIASQTIMLGAAEKGFGGCIIATANRKKLTEMFGLADSLEILLVLALGVPAQKVVIESLPSGGDIKYWTGDDGNHHVPKRSVEELLIGCYPDKK